MLTTTLYSRVGGSYLPSDNPASLVAWFRMGVGVTVTGSGVSSWADQSGNGRDLLQGTDTNRPAYNAGTSIITFDGSDNFLKCADFTLVQPEQISLLVSQVSWGATDYIFDGGGAGNTMSLFENTATPRISLFAGSLVADNNNMVIGQFAAVACVFNGASSSIVVNATSATTGNPGVGNGGGFTLGAKGDGTVGYAHISVKEVIIRNVDNAGIRAADQTYLMSLP